MQYDEDLKFYNKWPFHLGLVIFSIVADQLTKLWCIHRFTNEFGAPNHESISVIGDLIRFQLVFMDILGSKRVETGTAHHARAKGAPILGYVPEERDCT